VCGHGSLCDSDHLDMTPEIGFLQGLDQIAILANKVLRPDEAG